MLLDRDARPGADANFRDRYFHYDGLDRLTHEVEGIWDASTAEFDSTANGGGTRWQLDTLGNWDSLDTFPATAAISSTTLLPTTTPSTDDRSHNALNQLVEDPADGSGTDTIYSFDHAGNMISIVYIDGTSTALGPDFTYDAWNRLVGVGRGALPSVGTYEYNGLNWRTRRRAQLDGDLWSGTTEHHDYYYTAGWQMIEHRIDSDYDKTQTLDGVHDRIAQQVWGTRYIDDAIARRIDRNADDDYNDPSEDPYFYVTDHQFSVRAVVRDTGEVVERVNYSPYGEATHSYENDFNRDGVIDVNDPSHYMEQQPELDPGVRLLVPTSGSTPDENYYAELDVNRDGQVFDSPGFADFVPWHNETDGGTLSIPGPPTGWISDHEQHLATFQQGPDNPIGYTGHIFDPETRMYLARFRHYRPGLGRWIQADPAGYFDGMNTSRFASSSPMYNVDPLGLYTVQQRRNAKRSFNKRCGPDGKRPDRLFVDAAKSLGLGNVLQTAGGGLTIGAGEAFKLAAREAGLSAKNAATRKARALARAYEIATRGGMSIAGLEISSQASRFVEGNELLDGYHATSSASENFVAGLSRLGLTAVGFVPGLGFLADGGAIAVDGVGMGIESVAAIESLTHYYDQLRKTCKKLCEVSGRDDCDQFDNNEEACQSDYANQ